MISRSYRRSDAARSTYVSAISAVELARKTTAYQSASRNESAWRSRSVHRKDIPDPPDGLEHLSLEALVDLLTQPVNQHVYDVGARVEAVVPDVGQDHGFGHDPPGIAHQVCEQRKLPRSQRLEL